MLRYSARDSLAGVRAAPGAVRIPVRRAPDGALVVGADPLAGVLAAARGPVVCEVVNDPADPAFAGPAEDVARDLVALLAARGAAGVTVASFDWYALGVARDAGVRTAFATPPEVALGAAVAYAAGEGHPEAHAHWVAVLAEPAAVAAAHEAGVRVVAHGVPGNALDRLADAGVDGVVLDDD